MNRRSPNTSARRTATSAGAGNCLILLYHRVADLESDPQLLAVSPSNFKEHLRIIRRDFNPISLNDLVAAHDSGDIPPNVLVITFDDGYADNLEIAAPLLAEFDIPATIFVTPRGDSADREFWWDDLEPIILQNPRLPADLDLEIDHTLHHWRLTDGSDQEPSDPAWNVLSAAPVTERQGLYLFLSRILRVTPDQYRRTALDRLAHWAGQPLAVRPTHRVMTPTQLRAAASSELVEIGAHTLTDPVLSSLTVTEQFDEIDGSRRTLESIIESSVMSFSFPFGCRGDFGDETIAMVRNAGFRCACSNSGKPPHAAALVNHASNLFTLPRALVRNWPRDEFQRHLQNAFGARAAGRIHHASIGA